MRNSALIATVLHRGRVSAGRIRIHIPAANSCAFRRRSRVSADVQQFSPIHSLSRNNAQSELIFRKMKFLILATSRTLCAVNVIRHFYADCSNIVSGVHMPI